MSETNEFVSSWRHSVKSSWPRWWNTFHVTHILPRFHQRLEEEPRHTSTKRPSHSLTIQIWSSFGEIKIYQLNSSRLVSTNNTATMPAIMMNSLSRCRRRSVKAPVLTGLAIIVERSCASRGSRMNSNVSASSSTTQESSRSSSPTMFANDESDAWGHFVDPVPLWTYALPILREYPELPILREYPEHSKHLSSSMPYKHYR